MAIPGTSEVRRLPRFGKVRLGEKKVTAKGKEYPSALEHFDFRDLPQVEKVYGKKCTELDILLPSEKIEEFFPQGLRAYRKSGLFCASDDGVTARRSRVYQENEKTGEITYLDAQGEAFLKKEKLDGKVKPGEFYSMPCPHTTCPYFMDDKCKGIARFLFMLPRVDGLGVYEITTSSRNSTIDINSYVDIIRAMTGGRVAMIPLKLRLAPREVQLMGKRKTVRTLTLTFMGKQHELTNLRNPGTVFQLPTLADLDKDTPEDLYPHGGAKTAAPPPSKPKRASEKTESKALIPAPKPAPEAEKPKEEPKQKAPPAGEAQVVTQQEKLRVDKVLMKKDSEGNVLFYVIQAAELELRATEALAKQANALKGKEAVIEFSESESVLTLVSISKA